MGKCLPLRYRSCWNACPGSGLQQSRRVWMCPSWVLAWLFHLFYVSVPFPSWVTRPDLVTCTSDVSCDSSTTSPWSLREGSLCPVAWGAWTSGWGHISILWGWVFLWHSINTHLNYSTFGGFSVVSPFTREKKVGLVNDITKRGSALSTLTDPSCQGTITRCPMAVEVEVQTHASENHGPGEKWEVQRSEAPGSHESGLETLGGEELDAVRQRQQLPSLYEASPQKSWTSCWWWHILEDLGRCNIRQILSCCCLLLCQGIALNT